MPPSSAKCEFITLTHPSGLPRCSERKIDYFESRLDNIESMLRELAVSLNNSGRSPSGSTPESAATSLPPGPPAAGPSREDGSGGGCGHDPDVLYGAGGEGQGDGVSAFEGDSSMAAQTVFASEFLENAVTRSSLPHHLDPDLQSALSSLQQIVRMQNRPGPHESRFVNARPLPKGGVRELPMPPAHVVVAALREVKGPLPGLVPPTTLITHHSPRPPSPHRLESVVHPLGNPVLTRLLLFPP